MSYAEELMASGLTPIRTKKEYSEAFSRWGIPNLVVNPKSENQRPVGRKRSDPDVATVFVDDFDDGKPMAVVIWPSAGRFI